MPESAHEERRPEAHLPGDEALEGVHKTDSAFHVLEGMTEVLSEHSAFGHALHELGPAMTYAGGGIGAINMGKGLAHLQHAAQQGEVTGSEGSQATLDIGSGGLGVANLLKYVAGGTSLPLTIAAGLGGMAASGNEYAEDQGWYGKHFDEKTRKLENATFLNSIGDYAKTGWHMGHDALGDNIAGDVLGTITGGIGALGKTGVNTYEAIKGGAHVFNEDWKRTHPKSPDWMPRPLGVDPLSLRASDARLKYDIAPIEDALALLDHV